MQGILWLKLVLFSGFSILAMANSTSDLVYVLNDNELNGACNESDIEQGINPTNQNFPKQLDKCASDSWGEEEKTTKCIKGQYPKLSDPCAGCFGKLIGCSTSHCKSSCLFNHFSDACLECVDKKCRDVSKDNSFSLITCTGLEKNQLPPSKPHANHNN